MRHRKVSKKLARPLGHRRATLRNLAIALVKHQKIKTTKIKAKLAQSFTERLISVAKKDTLHARRHVFKLLNDRMATNELFSQVVPLFKNRVSGFSRIIRLPGARAGDGAEMVFLELTERSEKPKAEPAKKEKATKEATSIKKKEAPAEKKPKADKPEEPKHKLIAEEKARTPKKKTTQKEKQKKFLGSLRGFFKKGRDSL